MKTINSNINLLLEKDNFVIFINDEGENKNKIKKLMYILYNDLIEKGFNVIIKNEDKN